VLLAVRIVVEIEKIDYESITDAIYDITDGSADDKAKGQLDDKLALRHAECPDDNTENHETGYEQDNPGLSMQERKCTPGICGPRKIEKSRDDLHPAPVLKWVIRPGSKVYHRKMFRIQIQQEHYDC
jgi:hypothetical protein